MREGRCNNVGKGERRGVRVKGMCKGGRDD